MQQSRDKGQPSLRPGALRFKASRGMVLLLVVLPAVIVFGAGYFGFWFRKSHALAAASSHTVAIGQHGPGPALLSAGPWGLLEAQPTFLRIPDECLQNFKPSAAPRWVFRGYSTSQVLSLFRSVGVSADTLASLSNPDLWQVEEQQVVLLPSPAVVLGLTPAQRGVVYTVLAQFPENTMQRAPFFWRTKDEAEWLAQPVFTEQARTLVRRLAYPKGELSLLADVELLAGALSASGADVAGILKELSRKPAILPRLQIRPDTDVAAMMRYWGGAGLTKVMQPALEAVSRIPQGRMVSFLAVLPPFARQRLNTYPGSTDDDGRDGIWSAMNFFADSVQPAPVDPVQWKNRLKADYFPVFSDPRYGDILVISRPSGEVLQAGVYLADDLVFTRVGTTRWEPWTIMTLADLTEVSGIRALNGERPVISYYRNRIL
ncbi:MAG TPA: hypothetical protein VFZ59_02790 [Verrucomicrobiae bacterium]|nr:hypothetical protein [Verrucomicrobiae bacterium]